jgi:hypothetical protein
MTLRPLAPFAAATALMLAATAVPAAPTITFGGVPEAGGAQRSAVAGATTIDFGTAVAPLPATFGGVQYTSGAGGGGSLHVGSISGITAAPPLGNASAYLAVPSAAQQNASGSVVIDFGADLNYFGLFWGSIDSYNTIAFFLDGAATPFWSGTGDTVASPANGCQTCAGTNRYVNFAFGDERFDRIVLSSDGRAFESDNHAYGTVPVPGVLALLGVGLVGLAAAGRRRT